MPGPPTESAPGRARLGTAAQSANTDWTALVRTNRRLQDQVNDILKSMAIQAAQLAMAISEARIIQTGNVSIPAVLIGGVGVAATITFAWAKPFIDDNYVVELTAYSPSGVTTGISLKVVGKSATDTTIQYTSTAILSAGGITVDVVGIHN